jgi:predicted nuclease with TOPRIM domain
MQRKPILLACVLVLSGCSRDGETLDTFSRAYTAFSDVSGDTRVASIVVIFNDKKQAYWTELEGTLDQHASNKARLEHARAALKAESETIDGRFDAFNSALESLDRAVMQLVEIANSVRDREYREGAIGVSQRAREVHSAFESLRRLYTEAFSRRRKILEGIVADGGDLVPGIRRVKADAERITEIANEQEAVEQQLSSATDRLKDAFSALTGRAALKTYPSKWDDHPK